MAAYLKPTKATTLNGVVVNEYLLTKNNPLKIAMPQKRTKPLLGVTIHNTNWIKVNSATTPSEQYTRATVNGNMGDVRVHFYVDDKCAWQNLPLDWCNWSCADGQGSGNTQTIAIECIMGGTAQQDKKSRENAVRLIAYLLKLNGLCIDNLYTHTHWLNVRDGKKGTVDYLNTLKHPYKVCPAFFIPDWDNFKGEVAKCLVDESKKLYRIQIGAYSKKENAEKRLLEVKKNYPDAFIKVE